MSKIFELPDGGPSQSGDLLIISRGGQTYRINVETIKPSTVGGTVIGDLIPDLDNTYSLGSADKRWKDIFVSANTIHLGPNTTLSGTYITIAPDPNPTSLSQMPTMSASRIVAKPYTYNPGGGNVTVRPSIEFQDSLGNSYPISFNTATNEFSLDALGDHGTGSLVARKATLSNSGATALGLTGNLDHAGSYLNTSATSSFRFDGNTIFGYDSSNTLTIKAATTFQGPVTFSAPATIGDGNDPVTINAGAANQLLVTSSTFSLTGTDATFSTNLIVNGNLTVQGTTTTINSNTLNIGDNIIVLNADLPGGEAPTQDAGIQIARGSSASVKWIWNETFDMWSADGSNVGGIDALASNSISVHQGTLSGWNADANKGALYFGNTGTNSLTFDGSVYHFATSPLWNQGSLVENTANKGVANGYASLDAVGKLPSSQLPSITTTGVSEGTNLYYTDTRARAAISVSGDLSYNSTTGVISYTQPAYPVASTSVAGVVQLTDSISSTSTTTAATPNSVKTAYDLANAAMPKTGGTFSGNVSLDGASQTHASMAIRGLSGNPSLNIGLVNGTASTPFIDFNSGATAVDYDARIIANGGDGTSGGGQLTYTAKTHYFNNTPTFPTATAGENSTKGATTAFVGSAITTAMAGNAGSATKLATARTINGISFDGTENVSFSATIENSTSATYTSIPVGLSYSAHSTSGEAPLIYSAILTINHSNYRVGQINIGASTSSEGLAFRGYRDDAQAWSPWRTVWHSGNLPLNLSGAATGNVLNFNGTNWVPGNLTADDIGFMPSGNIAATTVKTAIEELDSEKVSISSPTINDLVSIKGTAPKIDLWETDYPLPAVNRHWNIAVNGGNLSIGIDTNGDGTNETPTPLFLNQTGYIANVWGNAIETRNNKGIADGYAPLNSSGKVPDANLPEVYSTLTKASFTATEGQTTFTIAGGYTPNKINVYVNGRKVLNGTDVTVTSGTDIVFATGLSAGAVVDVDSLLNQSVGSTVVYHPFTELGQCRFWNTGDGNGLRLRRHNGRYLMINGNMREIPAAGIAAPSGLSANTFYFIYAYWTGSDIALEASTTGYTQDSTYGLMVKSTDATRTLVGAARTDNSGTYGDHSEYRGVLSWFNQRLLSFQLFANSPSTASSTLVGLDTGYFICWPKTQVNIKFLGRVYMSAIGTASADAVIGGNAILTTQVYVPLQTATGTLASGGTLELTGGAILYDVVFRGATNAGTATFNVLTQIDFMG